MSNVRVIEVKKDVLADNDKRAAAIRQDMAEKGVFLLNIMASPGAGKTTLLRGILPRLKDKYRIAVMEADIDSDVDTKAILELGGVDAIQLHTGGMCHMDATTTTQGLQNLDVSNYDLVIVENIGNLVCPASFDLGQDLNLMLLSVPEGDDKALKYPKMFEVSNACVITKIDVVPYFQFDVDLCEKRILERNPKMEIFKVSAVKGDGVEELASWLDKKIGAKVK